MRQHTVDEDANAPSEVADAVEDSKAAASPEDAAALGEIEIRIRPLAVSDAQVMYEKLQDASLYTYIDESAPENLQQLQERYETLCQGAPPGIGEKWLNWIIVNASDGEPLGTLQATIEEESHRASIAYVVLPTMWGRGIATQGTEWLLDHLHDELGVAEAQVEIHEGNERSLSLARRLGFVDVEVRREGDHNEVVLRRRLGAHPAPRQE